VLHLEKNPITEDKVEKIEELLPDCKIYH